MPSHLSRQFEVPVAVLWAISHRYQRPQVVVAYSEGLADALSEEFDARIEEAKQWFLDFGDESDGPWTFWVDYARIPASAPDEEEARDAA